MPRRIPRNIFLLGLLSLFNDVTADMITPLLPAYLAAMGMGASFLGVMEGWIADRRGNSKALTVGGYSLSTFARFFLAIPFPEVTLSARVLDRVGKGIRTAPRDQMITASIDKQRWGEAFGIQRMMDHAGSLAGSPLPTDRLKAQKMVEVAS